MSENLRRLKREVSEKEIKAATVRHIKSEVYKYKYLPSEKRAIELAALSGMASVEELERKAEEARKEEERIKEQLKGTKEELWRILEALEEKLRVAATNEDNDYMEYVRLERLYPDMPTAQKVFRELADDERRHAEYLRKLANEIRREYSL